MWGVGGGVGGSGWQAISPHWSKFKSCTIKVCDSDTSFIGNDALDDNDGAYIRWRWLDTGAKPCSWLINAGKDIFHMHIDGKIGMREEKNRSQGRMSRLLFSIVTGAHGTGQTRSPFVSDFYARAVFFF